MTSDLSEPESRMYPLQLQSTLERFVFFFLYTLVFVKKPVCYIAQEGKFAWKIRDALVGRKQ